MDFVDTEDRDEAAAVFSRMFPDLKVHRDQDAQPFRFRYSRTVRGAWTRTVLDVRGHVSAFGTYPDHFAVGRRLRGRASIEYEDAHLDTTRSYLRPRGKSSAHFQDSLVELLIIERSALEARARHLLEGSGKTLRDPRPDNSAPLSPAQMRLWDATVDTLAPMFSVESPAADALLDELAATALLTAFPLTHDQSKPRRANVLPRAIRRATDYADAHLADPLTVTMLADAAGVSVRTIQEGFRRHLDTTPLGYVKTARLHATRRALVATARGESTVADISRRFGFLHPSRFARDYLQSFGEHPSDTLRG